jgi:hypothetical protein
MAEFEVTKQSLASFLDRVRVPVLRLRQTAVLNNDLATVISEIEALDAQSLPRHNTPGTISDDLPILCDGQHLSPRSWSSPCPETASGPSTPRMETFVLEDGWHRFSDDSVTSLEPSNTVNPRDIFQANPGRVANVKNNPLDPMDELDGVQALGRIHSSQYSQLSFSRLHREDSAEQRPYSWDLSAPAADQGQQSCNTM